MKKIFKKKHMKKKTNEHEKKKRMKYRKKTKTNEGN